MNLKTQIIDKLFSGNEQELDASERVFIAKSLSTTSKNSILESITNKGTCDTHHKDCYHVALGLTNEEVNKLQKKAFDTVIKSSSLEEALVTFISGLKDSEIVYLLDLSFINLARIEKNERIAKDLDLLGDRLKKLKDLLDNKDNS
jgi:hypothetical protein